MSEPFISLIVPVFNKEKYLARCLDSLLHQKLEYEVIIIDDCSQDSSIKIAAQYAERYDNFHFIALAENKGVGNARNIGVEHAQGDYLLFIDSDDWCTLMSMSRIQQLAEFYGYPDCGVFAYNRYLEGKYQKIVLPNRNFQDPSFHNLLEPSRLLNLLRQANICGSPWNKIYKREFWLSHGFSWPTVDQLKEQQVEGSEDFSLIPYVLAKAQQIMIANSAYYNYDLNVDSATVSVADDRVAASVRSAFVLRDRFENDPNFIMNEGLAATIDAMVFAHFRHFFEHKKNTCSDDQIKQFSTIFNHYIQHYGLTPQEISEIHQAQKLFSEVKCEMEKRALEFDLLSMFSTQEVEHIVSARPKLAKKKKNSLQRIVKKLKKVVNH